MKKVVLGITSMTLLLAVGVAVNAQGSGGGYAYWAESIPDLRTIGRIVGRLGDGFDPDNPYREIPPVISWGGVDVEDRNYADLDVRVIRDASDLREANQFAAEITAGDVFWTANMAAFYEDSYSISSDSLIVEIRARVEGQDESLAYPALLPAYEGMDPDAFVAEAGEYYIRRITWGAALTVQYRFSNLTEHEKSALAACFEINGPSFEIDACVAAQRERMSRTTDAAINVEAIGVAPEVLALIADGVLENPYAISDIVASIDQHFFAAYDPAAAVPDYFGLAEYPSVIFPYGTYNTRHQAMIDYFVTALRLYAWEQRISGILADEECMTRNLDPGDRAQLAADRARVAAFRGVVQGDAANCYHRTNLLQTDPSAPDFVLNACAKSPAYLVMEADLATNPVDWPVDLIDPTRFTFCQWCNRQDSTLLTSERRAAIDAMLRLTGYGPDSYACVEAELELLAMESINLNGQALSDVAPVASLAFSQTPVARLTSLDLSDNAIRDVEPLGNLIGLEVLDLRDNPVDDIAGLDRLTRMRDFAVGYKYSPDHIAIRIDDWSPLEAWKYLERFAAPHSDFWNVNLLREKPLLRYLDIYNTEISDLAPLSFHSLLLDTIQIAWTPNGENQRMLADLACAIRANIENGRYVGPGSIVPLVKFDPEMKRRWVDAFASHHGILRREVKDAFIEIYLSRDPSEFGGLCRNDGVYMNDTDYPEGWMEEIRAGGDRAWNLGLWASRVFLWGLEPGGGPCMPALHPTARVVWPHAAGAEGHFEYGDDYR